MSEVYGADAVDDLRKILARIDHDQISDLEEALLAARRIFVTGLGRTGLMARSFAMRLMHLGRTVYHVGDVITPAIQEPDLLVICSRTARSPVLRHYTTIARRAGARVAVVTANAAGTAAKDADHVLQIDDRDVQERRRKSPEKRPLPLGSLFEQALLIVLDQVVLALMDQLGLEEGDLARVHTTFE